MIVFISVESFVRREEIKFEFVVREISQRTFICVCPAGNSISAVLEMPAELSYFVGLRVSL